VAKYRIKVDRDECIYNYYTGKQYWYTLEKKLFLMGWEYVTGKFLPLKEKSVKNYFINYLKELPEKKKVIDEFEM
jgi:hypothetical protein